MIKRWGGHYRIRDTRICVSLIRGYMKAGSPDTELLESYPGRTLDDLDAVRAFYKRREAYWAELQEERDWQAYCQKRLADRKVDDAR